MKRFLLSPAFALLLMLSSCFGLASSPLPSAVVAAVPAVSASYSPEPAIPTGQLYYYYSNGWMYVYYWNGGQWILLTYYPWP